VKRRGDFSKGLPKKQIKTVGRKKKKVKKKKVARGIKRQKSGGKNKVGFRKSMV